MAFDEWSNTQVGRFTAPHMTKPIPPARLVMMAEIIASRRSYSPIDGPPELINPAPSLEAINYLLSDAPELWSTPWSTVRIDR